MTDAAQTLDEATLRRVFPNAPADMAVPRDVSSLYKARMQAIGGDRHGTYLWGSIGISVLTGLVGLSNPLAFVVPVLVAAIWIGIHIYQYSQAKGDFFVRYAQARGLAHDTSCHFGGDVPLLRKGDKRECHHRLSGTIANQPGSIGMYTYTDVSTDSEGKRSETDFDFTVIRYELPATVGARYLGVYLAPKSLSFGKLQDKLAHDRAVQLESNEFHKRYSLRVVDQQDDIALFELFSTTFIDLLATQLEIHWEQRSGDLVFYRKGHEHEAADLDAFCLESWHVLQRYLEEWQ